jgi:hypothetical protein
VGLVYRKSLDGLLIPYTLLGLILLSKALVSMRRTRNVTLGTLKDPNVAWMSWGIKRQALCQTGLHPHKFYISVKTVPARGELDT